MPQYEIHRHSERSIVSLFYVEVLIILPHVCLRSRLTDYMYLLCVFVYICCVGVLMNKSEVKPCLAFITLERLEQKQILFHQLLTDPGVGQ
jgi:hypothetical protein